jgi:CRP/FNR family cyclic AMP-dependent transcriptional regulator
VQHIELLRRVSIFRELSEAALVSLDRLSRVRQFPKNSVVVSAEERGDSLFVVAEGKVKVVLFGESGREMILSVFQEGDFFGEMALLDNQPRSATAVAMTDAKLLVLERQAFAKHLIESPRSSLAVLAELSRRLRKADEVIGDLALLDVYGRVARTLQELARRDGERTPEGVVIRDRPSGADLGAMVGTTRESASRALSDFQRRGLLRQSGRRLILSNAFLVGPVRDRKGSRA